MTKIANEKEKSINSKTTTKTQRESNISQNNNDYCEKRERLLLREEEEGERVRKREEIKICDIQRETVVLQ